MYRILSLLVVVVLLVSCGEVSAPGSPEVVVDVERDVDVVFPDTVVSGVALELAKARKAAISDINYKLTFRVPDAGSESQDITGEEILTFKFASSDADLPLDFREQADKLTRLTINGQTVDIRHEAEHLILPASHLVSGENTVRITFIVGDSSLNRNPDYLYTLFVPDRARTAFPLLINQI